MQCKSVLPVVMLMDLIYARPLFKESSYHLVMLVMLTRLVSVVVSSYGKKRRCRPFWNANPFVNVLRLLDVPACDKTCSGNLVYIVNKLAVEPANNRAMFCRRAHAENTQVVNKDLVNQLGTFRD